MLVERIAASDPAVTSWRHGRDVHHGRLIARGPSLSEHVGLDGANYPVHSAMERFASLVAQHSGGALHIDLFADGQLGQEIELLNLASSDMLDFVKASATVVERLAPRYHVLNLPFLFCNRAHARAVQSSPVGQEILASTAPKGLTGLTFYEAGSRSFYSRKPIKSRTT